MTTTHARAFAAALLVVVAGCGAATGRPASPAYPQAPLLPFTQADVDFMAGMIPHHAQALRMARLAPTNAGRDDIRLLAERIMVSQRDEIEQLQTWLRDRRQAVPAADATHHRMMHDGVAHDMLMPGMLTEEELAQLGRARGTEFDRLFLVFMIRHHQGAVDMVDKLFASAGAVQDEDVFRFASDVYADQTSEIDRMQKMLATLPGAPGRL